MTYEKPKAIGFEVIRQIGVARERSRGFDSGGAVGIGHSILRAIRVVAKTTSLMALMSNIVKSALCPRSCSPSVLL